MTQTAMDIDTRPLPAGWKWVKLGDISDAIRGVTFASGTTSPVAKPGLIPCLTTSAVQQQTDWSTKRYIPENAVKNPNQMLSVGDILVSTANSKALVGKSCLVDDIPFACTFGAFVTVIRPRPGIETNWVLRGLNSQEAKSFFYQASSNTTNISNLKVTDLLNLPIPLPPLEEQKRIAAILNEQMAAVEKAKKAAEERLEAAKALPAAYLREVFEGVIPISVESTPTDAPEGWKWELLTNVARLESGHTPSRKHPEYWENGDIPWLALPDIRAVDGKHCEITSENTNELGIKNSSARILPKGTVALSRTASVGFATIFDCPMATSQDFVNWVCSNKVLPEFLLLALISSRDYIRKLSSGATHKTVYVPTVKSFKICMPSTAVQEQVSEEYLGNRDSLNPISANIEQELETIEAMPSSLLRKAFSGEL